METKDAKNTHTDILFLNNNNTAPKTPPQTAIAQVATIKADNP